MKKLLKNSLESTSRDIKNKAKSLRFNKGKSRWSLIHYASIEPLVKVLEFGAEKYSRDNWKTGLDPKEILDSLSRHLFSLIDGEEYDKESGEHHIGHILANSMFYYYHQVLKKQETENHEIREEG